MPLIHHELCFGCGRTNLFGLLAELEPAGEGRVSGRCFIKQDHQGPARGLAHPGVVAAALLEAISLAANQEPRGIELHFDADASVGEFLDLEADRETATASSGGRRVASARTTGG